jgi:hypothetical protein
MNHHLMKPDGVQLLEELFVFVIFFLHSIFFPFVSLLRLVEWSACLANGFNTLIVIDEIFTFWVRRIVTSACSIYRYDSVVVNGK